MQFNKIELTIKGSTHVTNSYVLYDEISKEAVIIDPADEANKIIEYITKNELKIKYIILSHAHFDHVNALYEIQEYTSAPVVINKNEYDMLMLNISNAAEFFGIETRTIDDKYVEKVQDHDFLTIGNINLELIHTPGHTSGSMIIYNKNENVLFTGDTLFSKEYGRCDLETGDFNKMVKSLRYIFNNFNEDVMIYPGHGESSNLKNCKKYISLLIRMKGEIL